MPLQRYFAQKFCAVLIAVTFFCLPTLAADSLAVDQSTLNFYYTPGQPAPSPQQILVTGATGTITASITTNPTNPANSRTLFAAPSVNGSTVYVGVDANGLVNLPNNVYSGVLTVTSGAASATVTLNVIAGAALQISASPNPLPFTVPTGYNNTTTQVLTIASNAPASYTAAVTATSNGTSWLSLGAAHQQSVNGNTTGSNGTYTSNLQVAVLPTADMTTGNYTGTITVTPSGSSSFTVQVTLALGTGGSLATTPSSLTFVYNTGGTAPSGQPLYVYNANATTYSAYASSTGGWLLLNGTTYTITSAPLPTTISVVVSPTGLTTGNYTGTIYLSGSDGSTAQVNVTLSVNPASGLGVSPTSLTFSAPATGGMPQQQQAMLSSTGAVNFTASSNASWLQVYPASGSVGAGASTTLYITVSPTGLPVNTYTGSITVQTGSGTATINVTLSVGSGGGTGGTLAALPDQINFNVPAGASNGVPSQMMTIAGTTGTFTATTTSSTADPWFTVDATTGTIPGNLTVSLVPGVVNTLTAGQSATGTVTVQSGSAAPVTVNLKVNALSGTVLLAGPSTINLTYDAGAGGQTLLYQYVTLSSSDLSAVDFTATSYTSWIQVAAGSGRGSSVSGRIAGSGTIVILADVSGLSAGLNAGTVTVSYGSRSFNIPVQTLITGAASGTLNPTSLNFTAGSGLAAGSQTVQINTAGSGTFMTSVDSGSSGWLSATSNGSTPGTITVSATAAGLQPGTYNGTITVTLLPGGTQATVSVTFTVTTVASVSISLDHSSLAFDYTQGTAAPSSKPVVVSSSGGQVGYTASVTSGSAWLSVSPSSGNTQGTLTVSVSPSGLGPGTYTGAISVASSGAGNSPQNLSVTLTVHAGATLTSGSGSLTFVYRTDGAAPPSQTVKIDSTGASLPISVSSDSAWLTVNSSGANTPANLTISVSPSGLAAGSYTGNIVVSSASSSTTIGVTLNVRAPLPTITGVVNGASLLNGAVAGGETLVIQGTFLGPDQPVKYTLDNGFVPKTTGGVQVSFNGFMAPVLYAGATQVTAVVPYKYGTRVSGYVQVWYGGQRSNSFSLNVAATAPGVFTSDGTGRGAAVVYDATGKLVTASNAAARSTNVSVYVTGDGLTIPGGTDGRVYPDATALPATAAPVKVSVGGAAAKVVSAGPAAGMVAGTSQVVFEVPAAAPTGAAVALVVNIGNVDSQAGVTMAVK